MTLNSVKIGIEIFPHEISATYWSCDQSMYILQSIFLDPYWLDVEFIVFIIFCQGPFISKVLAKSWAKYLYTNI